MSHPLLARWLEDNLFGLDEYTTRAEVAAQMIADSLDIADRLERALDVCQWVGPYGQCGVPPWAHGPKATHAAVPLVTP
jgi:hypothetical protein